MRFRLAGALLLALMAAGGTARAGDAGRRCAPAEDLRPGGHAPRAMRVAEAAGRAHFLRGGEAGEACPGAEPACMARAYLVPGDHVVVTRLLGGFACAAFVGPPPRFAETTGWLARAALTEPHLPPPPPAAWAGAWIGDGARIVIRREAGGRIGLAGAAGSGAGAAEFAAAVTPEGDAAGFATDAAGALLAARAAPAEAPGCAVRLWLLGAVLAVADNGRCGNSHAIFNGFYHRTVDAAATK